MKHWFRLHCLAFTRTLGGLFRHPVGSLLNLLVIGITAALPLALWVLITSLSNITAQVSVDPQLSIFMRTSASADEVNALKATLKADARWAKVEFVPKDQALKSLQANLGTSDLTAGLPENPLPDAFVLLAKDNDPAVLEGLKKELAAITIVEEVQLDSDWARRLARITDLGRAIFEVVAGLLALALVLALAGWLLHQWDPVSKIGGTPSWALYCAGICATALTLLYWLTEIGQQRRWTSLVEPAAASPAEIRRR